MQLRLASNVTVESQFTIENSASVIAPLLFIPLVENSFKHGTSPVEKSIIKIELVEKNSILTFETFNTNFPQNKNSINNNERNGIGLENLKKRLLLIYPKDHLFTQEIVDGMFHVKVVIKL